MLGLTIVFGLLISLLNPFINNFLGNLNLKSKRPQESKSSRSNAEDYKKILNLFSKDDLKSINIDKDSDTDLAKKILKNLYDLDINNTNTGFEEIKAKDLPLKITEILNEIAMLANGYELDKQNNKDLTIAVSNSMSTLQKLYLGKGARNTSLLTNKDLAKGLTIEYMIDFRKIYNDAVDLQSSIPKDDVKVDGLSYSEIKILAFIRDGTQDDPGSTLKIPKIGRPGFIAYTDDDFKRIENFHLFIRRNVELFRTIHKDFSFEGDNNANLSSIIAFAKLKVLEKKNNDNPWANSWNQLFNLVNKCKDLKNKIDAASSATTGHHD
jgi:hypothetical protein